MTDTTAGDPDLRIIADTMVEMQRQIEKLTGARHSMYDGAVGIAKYRATQPSAGAHGEAPFAYAFRYIFEGDLRPTAWDFQKRPKEARDPVAGQRSGVEVVPLYTTPAQPDTGGWIVGNADDTKWRTWNDFGCSTWTEDRDKATRYHRREDAELVHREDEDAWGVYPYSEQPDTGDVAALRKALVTIREKAKRKAASYAPMSASADFADLRAIADAALSKPNAQGATEDGGA